MISAVSALHTVHDTPLLSLHITVSHIAPEASLSSRQHVDSSHKYIQNIFATSSKIATSGRQFFARAMPNGFT